MAASSRPRDRAGPVGPAPGGSAAGRTRRHAGPARTVEPGAARSDPRGPSPEGGRKSSAKILRLPESGQSRRFGPQPGFARKARISDVTVSGRSAWGRWRVRSSGAHCRHGMSSGDRLADLEGDDRVAAAPDQQRRLADGPKVVRQCPRSQTPAGPARSTGGRPGRCSGHRPRLPGGLPSSQGRAGGSRRPWPPPITRWPDARPASRHWVTGPRPIRSPAGAISTRPATRSGRSRAITCRDRATHRVPDRVWRAAESSAQGSR